MTLDAPHPAALDDERLRAECNTRRQRRSGPGGQHRNKVETAVFLHHRPSGLEAEAAERRSQIENLHQALRRLRVNLALAVRRPAGTAPSMLWQSRCRGGRIILNPPSRRLSRPPRRDPRHPRRPRLGPSRRRLPPRLHPLPTPPPAQV